MLLSRLGLTSPGTALMKAALGWADVITAGSTTWAFLFGPAFKQHRHI